MTIARQHQYSAVPRNIPTGLRKMLHPEQQLYTQIHTHHRLYTPGIMMLLRLKG